MEAVCFSPELVARQKLDRLYDERDALLASDHAEPAKLHELDRLIIDQERRVKRFDAVRGPR